MKFLDQLEEIIAERKAHPTTDSYTTRLLNRGENKIAQKVGEEATEVIVAALGQGRVELVAESADLLYHWMVLLAQKGVTLAEVEAELVRRHQKKQYENSIV